MCELNMNIDAFERYVMNNNMMLLMIEDMCICVCIWI